MTGHSRQEMDVENSRVIELAAVGCVKIMLLRSSYYCLRQIVVLWLVGVVLLPLLLQLINRPSNINYVQQCLLSDSAHQDDDELVQQQTTVDEIEMEMIQLERKNSLQENCNLSPIDETATVPASTSDPLLEPEIKTSRKIPAVIFIIDDKHRTMYCDVPKVASTNLKRLMLVLSGSVVLNTTDLSSIPKGKVHNRNPMRTLKARQFNDTLIVGGNDYTKFFFVRHPFERLVSAYQNKLASNNTIFNKMVGKKIIRKYRQNATDISMRKGHDVTFNEFVQFIVDEWRNGSKPLDAHWRPIVDLCLPCVMQYDFIGKFETLNRDVEYLLGHKLNESQWIGLFDSQPKAKTTSSLWKQTMKLISAEQLSQLNEVYDQDFRLFQYPHYYETTTQPFDYQSFQENEYI